MLMATSSRNSFSRFCGAPSISKRESFFGIRLGPLRAASPRRSVRCRAFGFSSCVSSDRAALRKRENKRRKHCLLPRPPRKGGVERLQPKRRWVWLHRKIGQSAVPWGLESFIINDNKIFRGSFEKFENTNAHTSIVEMMKQSKARGEP